MADVLFYLLPSPSWIFENGTLRIRAANSAAVSAFGYSEEKLRSMTVLDLMADERVVLERDAKVLSPNPGPRRTVLLSANRRLLDVETTVRAIEYGGEQCCLEVLHLLPSDSPRLSNDFLQAEVASRIDAERGLRESQQRYKSLFANSPYAIVRFGSNGRVEAVNAAAEQLTGFTSAVLFGRHYRHAVKPALRPAAKELFTEALAGNGANWDLQVLHRDGRCIAVSGVTVPAVVDSDVVGLYVILRDMSEQNRLTALIQEENDILNLIAVRQPLDHILHAIARTVNRQSEDMICAILLCSTDGKHLRFAAAPGLSFDYREAIERAEIGPTSGACGQVIATKKRVVCSDISSDPMWRKYRDLALGNGIFACCADPIVSSQNIVLGTFVVYYNEPRAPHDWELRLIDRSCNLARIAIERSASEQQLAIVQRALESVTAGIVITDAREEDNPVIYVNKAFEAITGYGSDEILGRNCRILQSEDSEPEAVQLIHNAIAAQRDCMVVIQNRRQDGNPFWNALTLSPVRDRHGRLTHWIGVVSDVTNRKKVSEIVRDSEERFRQLIENTSDIISIVECDGLIRYQSPSVERILGFEPHQMVGRLLTEFVHPEDTQLLSRLFEKLLDTPGAAQSLEARYRHADGQWRSIEQVATNLTGQPGVRGILLNSRDVTERREQQLKLDFLAHHDPLTNLPNRSVFDERLNAAIEVASRTNSRLAVLFLDLDRFKNINDTLGHRVGDQLLVTVGQRLTNAIRECDLVARWGGDEFALILPNISSPSDAVKASQRIIASLSSPLKCSGHELYVTGTIGISIYPAAGSDAETLVRNADTAMYRAKEGGKNYFQVYTAAMNTGAMERLTLETALRKALARKEFVLNYQPQLDLRTGRITGVEALVRWQHPLRGLIPPSEFIPLAEDTGLIIQLGEWILAEACKQAAKFNLRAAHPVRVAVNLSARQISRKEFVKSVDRALRDSGLPPTLLELELTESVLINDDQSSVKPLLDLRAMGVDLSVDDFGTGYSSFMYLRRYPVTSLKIDRSFIGNIGSDGDDATIVRSMIDMAHNLRLRVVAEGVETSAQHRFLCQHGCDEMQGYFYSAPIPAEALAALLSNTHIDKQVLSNEAV